MKKLILCSLSLMGLVNFSIFSFLTPEEKTEMTKLLVEKKNLEAQIKISGKNRDGESTELHRKIIAKRKQLFEESGLAQEQRLLEAEGKAIVGNILKQHNFSPEVIQVIISGPEGWTTLSEEQSQKVNKILTESEQIPEVQALMKKQEEFFKKSFELYFQPHPEIVPLEEQISKINEPQIKLYDVQAKIREAFNNILDKYANQPLVKAYKQIEKTGNKVGWQNWHDAIQKGLDPKFVYQQAEAVEEQLKVLQQRILRGE